MGSRSAIPVLEELIGNLVSDARHTSDGLKMSTELILKNLFNVCFYLFMFRT